MNTPHLQRGFSSLVVSSSKDTTELSLLDLFDFYCICGEHRIETSRIMARYKDKGQKKPYNVAHSRVHNVKNKVLTLDANKWAPLQTPQTAEAFNCSQCNDSDNGLLQCKCCDLWYCSKCCAVSEEALTIIGEFDSLHWYCQPCM